MDIIGKALGFEPVPEARAASTPATTASGSSTTSSAGSPRSRTAPSPTASPGLAAAAGATERVLLTTTMLSAPIRHPVESAQAIATIDRISGGRAELGIGGGWNRAEFEAVGIDLGTPATASTG